MSSVVAIVNWNSGEWLRKCVDSLLATAEAGILVIDNDSTDGSFESVQSMPNRITLIRNPTNRGFAAALNQAFHATSAPYVLVLNPDIRVMPGAVALLEEFMEAHPRAGAVGGYVNEKYLPRRFPTAFALIRENLGLSRPAPGMQTQSEAFAVDQPAAAALMIRRDAYDEIGGFDEQFFPAWYEDVDFCRRLKVKGWGIYFAPQAKFVHEGGYSADALGTERFVLTYYSNQLRYARKHLSAIAGLAVRGSVAAGMFARMVVRPRQAGAYAKALVGIFRTEKL